MKNEDEHLLKQVFSAVVMVLLLVTFYMLVAGSTASRIENIMTPLLLIIIAMIGLSVMLEVSRIGCMLSRKR